MNWVERENINEGLEEKETFRGVEAFGLDEDKKFRGPSLMAFYPHQVPPERGGGGNNEPNEFNNIIGFLSYLTLAEIAAYVLTGATFSINIILITVSVALILFLYKKWQR